MGDFWVGIRGDLTSAQTEALRAAAIPVYDLRKTAGAWGEPPLEWEMLRTYVPVSAADDADARDLVADALGLDAADLVAYSAEIFREMPTALDNGQRSPRKLLVALVRRLVAALGKDG